MFCKFSSVCTCINMYMLLAKWRYHVTAVPYELCSKHDS